jgi:hypothetical protein
MKISEERLKYVSKKIAADLLARKSVESRLPEEALARRVGASLRNRANIDEEVEHEARAALAKRLRGPKEGTAEYIQELMKLKVELARKRLSAGTG